MPDLIQGVGKPLLDTFWAPCQSNVHCPDFRRELRKAKLRPVLTAYEQTRYCCNVEFTIELN